MRFLALFPLLISGLAAQQLPDGKALMEQAASGKFHSIQYIDQSTMEMTTPGGPQKFNFEASTAKVNPGKSRTESKAQGMTFLMVSDGDHTTLYNSMSKEYVRMPAALGPTDMLKSMGLPIPDISKDQLKYKTLRDESIEIDGAKHDTWVVECTMGDLEMAMPQNPQIKMKVTDAKMAYWMDKKLDITLKMELELNVQMAAMPPMAMHQTMVKKDLKIDQPIADSLFAFTPPPDAKEVKEISMFGAMLPKAELVGKEAAAFEVKGMDGKTYSLASFKGKPVLLDFWATWCGPCRQSAPLVEKISREYKAQDLVVIAVDAGEERSAVEEFLKKNPMAYPAALSGDSGILEGYKVSAYPTFVLIGRDGKVAAEEIGYLGEDTIRGMLPKAGLNPPAK